MEKLQKALQKAREQRAVGDMKRSAPVVPARPSQSPSQGPAQTNGAAAPHDPWAALTPFEPDRGVLDKNLLVSMSPDQRTTPFDILRTKAQILMNKNGWSRLGVTSPSPGSGKTTTACNLALGFTRQTDIRVMLFELDLRRPSMAKIMGYTPRYDVTAMLKGDVSFEEQAVCIRENLAVSMALHPSADPTTVMLNQTTQDRLTEIERTYAPDLVIFDLPPLLVGDDTRAFLKSIDCALILAKAETTGIAQIDTCEREIAENTNVLGVVLNQCRHVGDTDYGYYSYS